MKEHTNIKHRANKTKNNCCYLLMKENWGADLLGTPFWRLSCHQCGFVEIIDNNTFLKWQYCDEVVG